MQTGAIEYSFNDLTMEGYYIRQPSSSPQPIVLIVHDWTGNRWFAQEKAEHFARQGFVGFAVDLYGKGKRGSDTDKSVNQTLLSELLANRAQIVPRLQAALDCALTLDNVDPQRIMMLGFCMGGLCALDFARSGAKITGVVSVHGLLTNAEHLPIAPINTKILVMHGYQDPMAQPEQLVQFGQEMLQRHADWQAHVFGTAKHAFTNPKANDPNAGLLYNQQADTRTWQVVRAFTDELFA